MDSVRFPAVSYIQTIAQVVNRGDAEAHSSRWNCGTDQRSILFSPTASQPSLSKHVFDICTESKDSPQDALSRTNLDSLLEKSFEGYQICIMSMGIGKNTESWRHDWMLSVMHQFKKCWENVLGSGSPKIEFSFCLLGLKEDDIMDYATLEILPMKSLLDRSVTLEDLLIQGDENMTSSLDSAFSYVWALLRRPVSLSCTVFKIHLSVTVGSSVYHGSLCLSDLGHYGGSLQGGLDAIKSIALLLQQPCVSADLPYDQHALTFLLSEYLGGKAQSCLVLHIDQQHADVSSISAIRFGELVRTIKMYPCIDLEILDKDQEEMHIVTKQQYKDLSDLVTRMISTCDQLRNTCEYQEYMLQADSLSNFIASGRASRAEELSKYEKIKGTIEIVEKEISYTFQFLESFRSSFPIWESVLDHERMAENCSALHDKVEESQQQQKALEEKMELMLKEHQDRIKNLEQECEQQVKASQDRLSGIKQERDAAMQESTAQKKRMEQERATLLTKLATMEQELAQQRQACGMLETELSSLRQLKQDLPEQIKQVTNQGNTQAIQMIKELEDKMHQDRNLYLEELKSARQDVAQASQIRDQLSKDMLELKNRLRQSSPTQPKLDQLDRPDKSSKPSKSSKPETASKSSKPKVTEKEASPVAIAPSHPPRKNATLARRRIQDESEEEIQSPKPRSQRRKSSISAPVPPPNAPPANNIYATSQFVPVARPKAVHPGAVPTIADENTSFLTNLSFHQPDLSDSNASGSTVTLRQMVRSKPTAPSVSEGFFPSTSTKASLLSNIMNGFHVQSIDPK